MISSIETTFGRVAYAHLCVSHAMKDFLLHTVNVQGKLGVLHDMPPVYFKRLSVDEIHSVLYYTYNQSLLNLTVSDDCAKRSTDELDCRKYRLQNSAYKVDNQKNNIKQPKTSNCCDQY